MPNTTKITAKDLQGMAGHWLACPPGGYLGSEYGADLKGLLQSPSAAGLADGLIDKCRQDVPILGQLSPGTMNIYAYDSPDAFDRKVLVFEVAGEPITMGQTT